MERRVVWAERSFRPGWSLLYTPAGGRLAFDEAADPPAGLSDDVRGRIRRLTSQACFAVPSATAPVSDDVRYVASVLLKILQRGENPVIRGRVADLLSEAERPGAMTGESVVASAIGPVLEPLVLDPAFELDPTYEAPLWQAIVSEAAPIARFVYPQPSLEALLGTVDGVGDRWADFLVSAPWYTKPVVVEIDGSQHRTARSVDQARDGALERAGYKASRYSGPEAVAPGGRLRRGLRAVPDGLAGMADPDTTRLLYGPAAVTRVGIAIALLLRDGHLRPGRNWDLDVRDPFDLALPAVLDVLDLLGAVSDIWSAAVLPVQVSVNGRSFLRDETGLFRESDGESPVADVKVDAARLVLEPFTAPHAVLPQVDDVPTAVVRGAHLPVDLAWIPAVSRTRRQATDQPNVDRGLDVLVRWLFGYDGFRPGQREAVQRILTGEDACVLLPTGAGKSLIYQIAGLLRPGLTLVVDPIVSLIDDQERRLRADGIDRVVAIHARRIANKAKAAAILELITDGGAAFAFVTPERLQTAAFREALEQVAEHLMVNLAVVDEAHCVSEWGHDFRAAYLRVGRNLRLLCSGDDDVLPPLLALTGTASPAVLRDLRRELEWPGQPFHLHRADNFDRTNLTFDVVHSNEERLLADVAEVITTTFPDRFGCTAAELVALARRDTRSGLIFTPHVNGSLGLKAVEGAVVAGYDRIAQDGPEEELLIKGRVGLYSGSPPRGTSTAMWESVKSVEAARFLSNETAMLISTKAFGMGVDKPNIRWTVHVGFPSSIESFAQEAGRAGRDGLDSQCVLVTSLPSDDDSTRSVLDPLADREERAKSAANLPESDLKRQLYFLNNSFKGQETEFRHSSTLLRRLLPKGSFARVEIPRQPEFQRQWQSEKRPLEPTSGDQEKALYRLAMIGVVDDYTIEYGSRKFTIDLGDLSPEGLDRALLDFADRIDPGRLRAHRQALSVAPESVDRRAEHHLRHLLNMIYGVVEPARVHALAEMYRLTRLGRDQDDTRRHTAVRDAIRSYLSDGLIAAVLVRVAARQGVDVTSALAEIDAAKVDDPSELAGAAARQLQAYPDQPVLRVARGVGEALRRDLDPEVVEVNLRSAFARLGEFGVGHDDALKLFRWITRKLRSDFDGQGRRSLALVWQIAHETGLPADLLEPVEEEVLASARQGDADPAELRTVLARRVHRWAGRTAAAWSTPPTM
ncbi:DEAD/DEAH box helicase [Myceligenerans indicum]|uniref:DNA 3'-5' helicase n=1 Tax=Myceligenerans indicum TaxID=2593663 RepID=A0ABS1LJE8_9MICO|nr:DEAD/DEAH box helicase [Myceligenerans indicum]MBL0886370.1 DEAD/DEAH box helicase [Myceligenerans indicum]